VWELKIKLQSSEVNRLGFPRIISFASIRNDLLTTKLTNEKRNVVFKKLLYIRMVHQIDR
jgi:hypothetical protein